VIVVDENSAGESVLSEIRGWYRGRVCGIRDLLPGAVIKDEMIPRLLARESQPTFVTTNVSDFWQLVRADRRYCVVCLPLSNERRNEIPALLRRVLSLEAFRTKRSRMGKVILAAKSEVRFYDSGGTIVCSVSWLVHG